MDSFIQRHGSVVMGSLSGFDRLRFRGTMRWLSCSEGMGKYLSAIGVRIKEFDAHVSKVTRWIREATVAIAQAAGRPLRYLASSSVSKEEHAQEIGAEDGIRKGLICVLSCVEPCWSFGVYRDDRTGLIQIGRRYRKCLHYYFYLRHPRLGFMHLRLQSWYPFGVHVCLNGREWLAQELDRSRVGYVRRDNCFAQLSDLGEAQRLMDQQLCTDWPGLLNGLIARFHPVHRRMFPKTPYYWSVEQSEWATDIMFRTPQALAVLYPRLIHHAMKNLGSREVMRFLGRRVPQTGGVRANFHGEVVSDLRERPEGMRVKHRVNRNSVKMYDKQGSVLRVETTINDPEDIKVFRRPEGQKQQKRRWRRLRKGVADLHRRAEVSQAANSRYLESMATVEDHTALGQMVGDLCRPVRWRSTRVRALNPMAEEDARLLGVINRGEFCLKGFRNRDLVERIYASKPDGKQDQRRRSAAVTRKIRMLRAHGLIRKIPGSHRYFLSDKGRRTVAALLAARAADTKKLIDAA